MIQNNTDTQSSTEYQKTETPSLVNTRQGVSVLYKNHFLYSKYDPSKSILNIISNTDIPDYSIVLIFSPVLWLGLEDLLKKLPSTSIIAAFEFDSTLFDFASSNIPDFLKPNFESRIKFYNKSNIVDFYATVQTQHYRKSIRLDFSGGSIFFKDEYSKICLLTQSIIDQFWKNRLTLIKFGRLFSKNIFKNLHLLSQSIPLKKLYNYVEKPILVLGAGESLNNTISVLKQNSNKFFIIAVDAAAAPLMENDIEPDAIIAVEAQQVIEKAYIGKPAKSKVLLIMDLVSRNHIPYITGGNISFFISKFTDMGFLTVLEDENILPPVINPLGSVGLVAMEIALKLRKDADTSIYFSGLDFSYSPGITHAKGTPAHKNHLFNADRLKSIFNFAAAFGTGTSKIISKDSSEMITSKSLENYAKLFSESYKDMSNLYDIGKTGIDLGIAKIDFDSVIAKTADSDRTVLPEAVQDNNLALKVSAFFDNEKSALLQLKDLFSYGNESTFRDPKIDLNTQIESLLKSREYLYIHFPDAVGPTNLQSFYNRIRIELDFFIKEIETSQTQFVRTTDISPDR